MVKAVTLKAQSQSLLIIIDVRRISTNKGGRVINETITPRPKGMKGQRVKS